MILTILCSILLHLGSLVTATEYISIEPLVTPIFLREINPLLLKSLSKTLTQMDIQVPSQTISLPFSKPIQLNVQTLKVTQLKWSEDSGLYFGQDMVGFHAIIDTTLEADYTTDSSQVFF